MKFHRLLTDLGVNAVPAAGWFSAEWSPGTTLALYWFETFAASLFIAARVLLHRRATRLRGHFRYTPSAVAGKKSGPETTFLGNYLPTVLAFSGAHLVFILLLVGTLFPQKFGAGSGIDWASFRQGATGLLVLLILDFAIDLPGLRNRPFRWIELQGEQNLGRVVLIHVTIVGGMFLAMTMNQARPFFGVFMVLKTMADLGRHLPQYRPKTPPAWLARFADRVGSPDHQGTFAEFWQKTDAVEDARQRRHEERMK